MITPKQRKWVETLETTTKKQGQRALHNIKDDAYCCLGICESLFCDSESVYDKGSIRPLTRFHHGGTDCTFFLTDRTTEELRFYDIYAKLNTPITYKGEEYSSLYKLNDDGVTFKEIAAIIRSDPANVFIPDEEYEERVYLDWVNNFISVEAFAEHYDMTIEQANAFLESKQ